MNIVLEGPDNAGKTTLANHLKDALKINIRHSGGPSKHPGEVNERAINFINDDKEYIYDRHPCISQNIYVAALGNTGEKVLQKTIDLFYESKPFIIYCRSKGTLEGHEQSEHSSEEYFKQVEENYRQLCHLYDHWGLLHANLLYRIGDDIDLVIDVIRGIQ